jgi:hypothetical protein
MEVNYSYLKGRYQKSSKANTLKSTEMLNLKQFQDEVDHKIRKIELVANSFFYPVDRLKRILGITVGALTVFTTLYFLMFYNAVDWRMSTKEQMVDYLDHFKNGTTAQSFLVTHKGGEYHGIRQYFVCDQIDKARSEKFSCELKFIKEGAQGSDGKSLRVSGGADLPIVADVSSSLQDTRPRSSEPVLTTNSNPDINTKVNEERENLSAKEEVSMKRKVHPRNIIETSTIKPPKPNSQINATVSLNKQEEVISSKEDVPLETKVLPVIEIEPMKEVPEDQTTTYTEEVHEDSELSPVVPTAQAYRSKYSPEYASSTQTGSSHLRNNNIPLSTEPTRRVRAPVRERPATAHPSKSAIGNFRPPYSPPANYHFYESQHAQDSFQKASRQPSYYPSESIPLKEEPYSNQNSERDLYQNSEKLEPSRSQATAYYENYNPESVSQERPYIRGRKLASDIQSVPSIPLHQQSEESDSFQDFFLVMNDKVYNLQESSTGHPGIFRRVLQGILVVNIMIVVTLSISYLITKRLVFKKVNDTVIDMVIEENSESSIYKFFVYGNFQYIGVKINLLTEQCADGKFPSLNSDSYMLDHNVLQARKLHLIKKSKSKKSLQRLPNYRHIGLDNDLSRLEGSSLFLSDSLN